MKHFKAKEARSNTEWNYDAKLLANDFYLVETLWVWLKPF